MRFRDEDKAKPAAENMVPLINIVFLILIFFLIAANIRPFADDSVNLAESVHAGSSEFSQRMLIVRSDGSIHSGGVKLEDDQIALKLDEWTKNKTEPVVLIADRDSEAARVIHLIAKARSAGLSNVRLITQQQR